VKGGRSPEQKMLGVFVLFFYEKKGVIFMPTPYTEGNGCVYLWKTNSQYKCSCQGPETVECTCYSIADATKCEYFRPESEEVKIYFQQLKESVLEKASFLDKDSYAKAAEKNDPVNHPSHYTAGGIECIDAIAAALSCHKDPVEAWLTGQIIKYIWRWPLKNGLEDLEKAEFYLERLMGHIIESKDEEKNDE
jgi:hypothetical protein